MKCSVGVLLFFVSFNAFAYPKECVEIENKLISLNQRFNAANDLAKVSEELKDIDVLLPKMTSVVEKYPECKKNTIPLTQKLMASIDIFMANEKKKDEVEAQRNIATPKKEDVEIFNHITLKERLDIGPKLTFGKVYKVTSLYGELYDGLCKPIIHRNGKELCDDVESLIKNIYFDFLKQETKTIFYRNKKSIGCFTFIWSEYEKLKITDYQVGSCN